MVSAIALLCKGNTILVERSRFLSKIDVAFRIQAGLQIAVRLKLADPQGFINVNDNNPIQFIDIHYGNDTSVGQLLEIVNQRLGALP